MNRGLFLAAATLLAFANLNSAEPEKIPFKQTGSPPRDLPDETIVIPLPSARTVAFLNYQETLKGWRSAKKRLEALAIAGKMMQGDPSADKSAVSMISLMTIEKTKEVESLRSQLAMMLVLAKLEDPSLPSKEREEIVKSTW
jgi:hypothetical protein